VPWKLFKQNSHSKNPYVFLKYHTYLSELLRSLFGTAAARWPRCR